MINFIINHGIEIYLSVYFVCCLVFFYKKRSVIKNMIKKG